MVEMTQLDLYGRATVEEKGCMGLTVCLLTLLRCHGMQHRVHLAMSFNMNGQTKRTVGPQFISPTILLQYQGIGECRQV
ncbi:hypothetical protein TNIN_9441 [Trichonephila inaurata madagascariensis]|uniref:Uncharacterized protein n=1 Tax=Trichonephila inaurata madagascariensis TaxID=2747483 RepID=A0A8X7C001_9ARAC|nr:hypothetical protein TNIN_9441 [Trichonephila inaurata madagascariensis]